MTSLSGSGSIFVPDSDPTRKNLDPTDYRLVTAGGREFNREICLNSGPLVKAWASWHALQEDFVSRMGHKPQDMWESWDWLNGRDGPDLSSSPRIGRLDRMIKAMNDDGLVVVLTVQPYSPTWASTYGVADPEGRDPRARVPDDVTTSGPWAMFLSHLLCRYKAGVPANPTGPTASAPYGNPAGARINLLEVVNEPNHSMWPQRQSNGVTMICKVADMLRSAESLAVYWGWPATGQGLLGPGCADRYTPFAPQPADPNLYTDFDTFNKGVLDLLQNWKPRLPFGWSQHNYYDIRQWQDLKNADGVTFESRVAITNDRLKNSTWKGTTVDGKVWLTEGGYDKHFTAASSPTAAELDEADSNQDVLCRRNYNRMWGRSYIPIWTYYGTIDLPPSIRWGMRDASRGANGITLGRKYMIEDSWQQHMPPVIDDPVYHPP
ncbi:MAG TPA: hypothetical protein VF520_16165 [Thermoleophilaceae bacterium]